MCRDSLGVYIVDDDEALGTTMEKNLARRGYRTHTYRSAEQFLAEISPDARGCLLLDLKMPDMDGLELQSVLN